MKLPTFFRYSCTFKYLGARLNFSDFSFLPSVLFSDAKYTSSSSFTSFSDMFIITIVSKNRFTRSSLFDEQKSPEMNHNTNKKL